MSSAHERVNGAAPATSLDNHRAAMALLGSQIIDGRWVSLDWDLRTGDWGAVDITRLDTEQYSAHPRAVSSACFESHTTLRLPDRPPIRPVATHTDVHRFVLTHDCARAINAPLHHEAVSRRDAGGGSRRSNIGGFHSVEETWNHAGSSGGQWYGRLYDVMIEALRALATPQQAPGTPADEWLARRAGPEPAGAKQPAAAEAEPKMSGWLNVSTAEDFNTVYYVADGSATLGSGDDGDVGTSAGADSDGDGASPCCCAVEACYAGSLLLKTQLGSAAYGFLPVVTRPGDLWVFPGYLAHAVMPRTIRAAQPLVAAGAGGGSVDGGVAAATAKAVEAVESKPRISVAVNVTACNGIDGPAWTGWAGRREQLYLLSDRQGDKVSRALKGPWVAVR